MCLALKLKYSHIVGQDTQYPRPHRNTKNYCISFRQKYFQHWSINVWSLNEWTLWPIQRNMTKKKDWSLIEENLGLATRFPQVRAALARSTNLEAIEDILKQRHHYFETILTPRAGISMDVKLFFSRKSLSTLSLCVGVRLLDVESLEFEGGKPNHQSSPITISFWFV